MKLEMKQEMKQEMSLTDRLENAMHKSFEMPIGPEMIKYNSPIEVITGQLRMEVELGVCKAVQDVGINVDKEELIKALNYDRDQYIKGYSDGYTEAIMKFADRLKKSYGGSVHKFVVDKLVEEMVGESDG